MPALLALLGRTGLALGRLASRARGVLTLGRGMAGLAALGGGSRLARIACALERIVSRRLP